MSPLIICAYNMDNCYVELQFFDERMIIINCIAVENEINDYMYHRSELEYLLYNDLIG